MREKCKSCSFTDGFTPFQKRKTAVVPKSGYGGSLYFHLLSQDTIGYRIAIFQGNMDGVILTSSRAIPPSPDFMPAISAAKNVFSYTAAHCPRSFLPLTMPFRFARMRACPVCIRKYLKNTEAMGICACLTCQNKRYAVILTAVSIAAPWIRYFPVL